MNKKKIEEENMMMEEGDSDASEATICRKKMSMISQ